MKQTLTFTRPIIASTESKFNGEAFDASVEAFENHEYLKAFYALLDSIMVIFGKNMGMFRAMNLKFLMVRLW